jgi:phage-related protein
MGDTLDRVRRFSAEARADIGYQLELVQSDETPTDFRPLPDVGPGAAEIRVHAGSEYRVFYVAFSRKQFTFCTAFRRKRKRRGTRISNWDASGTARRWNGGNRKATHENDKG